jgi:hypothetical protein
LRVAVVWRGDEDARRAGLASNERLRPVFDALESVGISAQPVVYRDEIATSVRSELVEFDGVLVWIDPIGRGEDRRTIDAILSELAEAGVWVGARPDVIAVMGTKDVLFRTRALGWGSDVHRYATFAQLRRELPRRLASGPRVLKPRRGNGGIGVWKVQRVDAGDPTPDARVQVHGAEIRDTNTEEMSLDAFLQRCASHFDGDGCVIDQPFHPRIADGLIRCYLVADCVVGFARQSADGLPSDPASASSIMGLPSPKTMYPPDATELARLRARVEHEWMPAMRDILGLEVDDLPALWDADFVLGEGDDQYVLCEINCSCVTPFPPGAPPLLAARTLEQLTARR